MVKGYVFAAVDQGEKFKTVIESLKSSPLVVKIDLVTGPYDIIAIIEAEDAETVRLWLINSVQKIDGLKKAETVFVVNPSSKA